MLGDTFDFNSWSTAIDYEKEANLIVFALENKLNKYEIADVLRLVELGIKKGALLGNIATCKDIWIQLQPFAIKIQDEYNKNDNDK